MLDRNLEKRILNIEESLEKLQATELDRKIVMSLKIVSELSRLEDDENKEEYFKNLIEYADQSAGLFSGSLNEDLRGLGDVPFHLAKKQDKIKKEIDTAIKKKISKSLKNFYKIYHKLLKDYEKSQEGK